MAHKKETPRQKMIGMMYLVLTALLALNVSKDILDAFVIVDESLSVTTENFTKKNQLIYDDFQKAFISNEKKVGPWKSKADSVRKEANELYSLINSLKIRVVKETDNDSIAVLKQKLSPDLIKAKDNKDVCAEIMMVKGEGKKLKDKIIAFREHLLSMVDKKEKMVIDALNKNLDTDPPKPKVKDAGETHSWESEHFEHLPLIAVTTIMSKLQSDVRNAEAEITSYLYGRIESGSFKFNKLEAIAIPSSNYVLSGTDYKAKIFLAAYDSTQQPTITVDGSAIQVKDGYGIYSVRGSGAGTKKYRAKIELKATDAPTITREVNQEYQVATASAVISPTKMNVFYYGVDNPVDISVAGIPANKINARMSAGNISKNGNSYIVRPSSGSVGSKVTVTVTADLDGKSSTMGSMVFRVKQIPDPVAKIGGKKGGSIGKNELVAQQVVLADLGETFDFDVKFNVTEFTISVKKNGFDRDAISHSTKITEEQKELLRSLNKGERVTITDIKAVGPDKKVRELNGIILKIQ
jgi:gliding motility-associated protein GldM